MVGRHGRIHEAHNKEQLRERQARIEQRLGHEVRDDHEERVEDVCSRR
jgi:hypothetical protein